MGVKRTSGITPSTVTPTPAADAPVEAQQTPQTRPEPQLPPAASSLRDRASPLKDQITAGLTQLAKAQGWEAQQNALDVLVGAMIRPTAAAPKAAAPDPLTEGSFVKMLAQTGVERTKAQSDGKQLARLALVALGVEALPGRPTERRAQLKRDLEEVHHALSDVVSSKDPTSAPRLEQLAADVTWVGQVLSRSKGADSASDRLTALAGMLKILVGYLPRAPAST